MRCDAMVRLDASKQVDVESQDRLESRETKIFKPAFNLYIPIQEIVFMNSVTPSV